MTDIKNYIKSNLANLVKLNNAIDITYYGNKLTEVNEQVTQFKTKDYPNWHTIADTTWYSFRIKYKKIPEMDLCEYYGFKKTDVEKEKKEMFGIKVENSIMTMKDYIEKLINAWNSGDYEFSINGHLVIRLGAVSTKSGKLSIVLCGQDNNIFEIDCVDSLLTDLIISKKFHLQDI